MPVTIHDVAGAAGVSVKTVSRVINNERWVQAETRARVMQAIEDLDFHPNVLARNLVAKRTRTIGLVVPAVSNPFFALGIDGCAAVADDQGYALSLAGTGIDPVDPEHEVRRVRALLAQRVAGIIVWASSLSSTAMSELMAQARHLCPVVFIDRPVDAGPLPGARQRAILVRQEDVGAMATGHLLDEGRRRVAHISAGGSWPTEQRIMGYRKALVSRGEVFESHLIRRAEHATIREGGLAAAALLAQRPFPDAIFAYNDLLAIGALLACREAGRNVPDDVAIVGVDDTQLAAVSTPPLSTIRLHQYRTGRLAVELIVRMIESDAEAPPEASGEPPPPELIVRHSSRAASTSVPSFEDFDQMW